MSETKRAGYTRYWCRRCGRQLRNDPRRKDTITVREAVVPPSWTHDGCGGTVLLSTPQRQ